MMKSLADSPRASVHRLASRVGSQTRLARRTRCGSQSHRAAARTAIALRLALPLGMTLIAMVVTVPAWAQVSPTSPPHPNMPWNLYNPTKATYGEFVRYIQVPPQQVTIQLPVPGGQPDQLQPQSVEIPGYVVTETTTGFWYPERRTLNQLGPSTYQWVQLPAEFKQK